MAEIDLVAWDFGDTLVHERFMRIAPDGVPEWPTVYDRFFEAHPEFEDRLDHGRASMIEMIPWLAEQTGMTGSAVARHLRHVWTQIEWFEPSRRWLLGLSGRVAQAVVTVNPFEFSGMATACGLDPHVELIVTSADIGDRSKPAMARVARELLGLPLGLGTTVLIDNRADNVADFVREGGHAIHFRPEDPGRLDDELAQYVGPPG